MNYSNQPGQSALCGAGEFTGVRRPNNTIQFSFISRDPDPGCGFDYGLKFIMNAALATDLSSMSGTYQVGGQSGVFYVTRTLTLSISHIEVTQAIQDTANSVPLIAGKPTFVRVYVDCGAGCTALPSITTSLQVSSPTGSIALSIGPKTVYHSSSWTDQRGDYSKTFNFGVPTTLMTGTVMFTATVDTAISERTYTFEPARTLRVAYVPIHYEPNILNCIWTGPRDPDGSRIAAAFSWALKAYPTNRIEYLPWPTTNWGTPLRQGMGCRGEWDDEGVHQLKFTLTLQWALDDNVNRPDYIFGWLPQGAIPGGDSDPTWNQGIGVAAIGHDEPDGPRIFAHEIAHLMGRRHTNSVSCIPEIIDLLTDWPYTQTNSLIQDWGLDLLPKNPNTTYDYMSYCGSIANGDVWTSSWTYSHLYSQTLSAQTSTPEVYAVATPQLYFISSGLVYTNDIATLNPVWVITTTAPTQNPPLGTQYCLEAQDTAATILASHCFDLDFVNYETGATTSADGFSIMLPYPSNTARIVLVKGGQELANRSVTLNAPIVSVLAPGNGDSWAATGSYTVTWTASDADSDALTYSVLYSPNGNDWMPIRTAVTETQLVVDSAEFAGGIGARIRVLATDGVNTSVGESASFAVESKGPQAYILSPAGDSIILPGIPLFLQGYAYDLEDGALGDTALQWNSSRDGNLGTGSAIVANLSYGLHIITLAATDSNGNNSVAGMTVFIGSKVDVIRNKN